MVIFGAGASCDSVPSRYWSLDMQASPLRPPLARELFDPRSAFITPLSTYKECAGLVAHLRARLDAGGDLEEVLQAEYERAPERGEYDQRAFWALRLYLHDIIDACGNWGNLAGGATNYAALIRAIEGHRDNDRVALVTFNYDMLLEGAMERVLLRTFDSFGSYMHDPYSLFKLHGSVGWSRRFGAGTFSRSEIIQLAHTYWNESGNFETRQEAAQSEGAARIPAIAVPLRSKNQFECPPTHVTYLEAAIPQVDRILVVGWRGHEENFLALLKKLLPQGVRGLVVSREADSARETVLHLERELSSVSWRPSEVAGFSTLVGDDVELGSILAP